MPASLSSWASVVQTVLWSPGGWGRCYDGRAMSTDTQAELRATLQEYLDRCIINELSIEAETVETTPLGDEEPTYRPTGRYRVSVTLANSRDHRSFFEGARAAGEA